MYANYDDFHSEFQCLRQRNLIAVAFCTMTSEGCNARRHDL